LGMSEDGADATKENVCVNRIVGCPCWTARFLWHTGDDNLGYCCLLRPLLWVQLTVFLVCVWLISGAFWLMCYYFTLTWPMKSLYAYLVVFGLFVLLFIFLMATDKQEDVDGAMGCSKKQLMEHIDGQKDQGMDWAQYGTQWHIVHRLPLKEDNANLSQDERMMQICRRIHYTNLEPVWDSEHDPRKNEGNVEEKKDASVNIHS